MSATEAHRLGSRQDDPNVVYFPPQDGNPSVPLQVHVGDVLNVTWSTTWPGVDLGIRGSAPGTNFTATPFFTPNLASTGSFAYRLQVHDYYIDDTSAIIQAFFYLGQSGDATEFLHTQNFTIAQPQHPDDLDYAGVPRDAATWTGSVSLYAAGTAGQLQASRPPGASFGSGSAPTGAAGLSAASASAVDAADGTSPTSFAGSTGSGSTLVSQGLSVDQKVGIGVGVALGILLLLGLAVAACTIVRRRRVIQNQNQPKPVWNYTPYGAATVKHELPPAQESQQSQPSQQSRPELSAGYHDPQELVGDTGRHEAA